MIKNTVDISEVKKAISKLTQKPVTVMVDLGRNKRVSFEGTLTGVYPALFTVIPHDKSFKGKTSYSYSEYMCGKVSVKEIEQK
ncbi:MAG: Veg family protein [Clostridia bacterium]|nr:Veg family protein [Clostridia bacterium]